MDPLIIGLIFIDLVIFFTVILFLYKTLKTTVRLEKAVRLRLMDIRQSISEIKFDLLSHQDAMIEEVRHEAECLEKKITKELTDAKLDMADDLRHHFKQCSCFHEKHDYSPSGANGV